MAGMEPAARLVGLYILLYNRPRNWMGIRIKFGKAARVEDTRHELSGESEHR